MRRAATLALATLCLGLCALGQEIPTPPDHYAAFDPFFEGQIVETLEDGGVIKIEPVPIIPFREMVRGEGERRGTWIEFRYAKGWVFFDGPEDGPQRRYNLREGRSRLEVGQIIAVGREPTEGGGWDHTSIKAWSGGRGRSGGRVLSIDTQVRLHGWILARVTPFREGRREGS